MTAIKDVLVIGAGVAGLNAAMALAADGAAVTLLERRAFVGGRAYSYPHPALEEVVDSQHVLLGCCTNLRAFCADAGMADHIRWYGRQTFLLPGEPPSSIAVGPVPAPLHYAESFLRAGMLRASDKVAIARGLLEFAGGESGSDEESAAAWYRRTGQTPRAIRRFWEPILLATLNDSSARCSMRYAGKVFYEIFLKNAEGGRLGIPTLPLSEFYAAACRRIERLGGKVELRASVDALARTGEGWRAYAAGHEFQARHVVLATAFEPARQLLSSIELVSPSERLVRAALLSGIGHLAVTPFLSLLLWFDREITELPHAWLLESPLQWFFHKSRIRSYPPERGSYVELVVAGPSPEMGMRREELQKLALAELQRFFPRVAEAALLKSGVLKEARATFSVTPGLDALRLSQRTGLTGLYLAGDWTATDWPSTMEGAARSGRLAAGEIAGKRARYLVPDLPASAAMRWLTSGAD